MTQKLVPNIFKKPLRCGVIKWQAYVAGFIEPVRPIKERKEREKNDATRAMAHWPSRHRKYVGGYSTEAKAIEAANHFIATGEKLPSDADHTRRAPLMVRKFNVTARIGRHDCRGYYFDTNRQRVNVYVGSYPTEREAREAGESWARGEIVRKPARMTSAPRARTDRNRAERARPATFTVPRRPDPTPRVYAAGCDPRAIRPGESRTDWMRRIYSAVA